MSKIAIAKTNELSREEWLKLRQRGIGGSEAAVACGLSRFKSRLMLYLEKTSAEIEDTDTEAKYWGRTMEPILRQEFAKRTGFMVQEIPYMFACKEYPWMLANIDGLVTEAGTKALLEIKTANSFKAKEWDSGIPTEYYLQVQHYLCVTDLPKAWICVLIGGNDFRYFPIDRDSEAIETLISLEADFWKYIERGIQPPVDEQSADGLDALYPQSDNKSSIILPNKSDDFVEAYIEVKHAIDELTTVLHGYENNLKHMMKDSSCAMTPKGYSIKWASSVSNRLDISRLKKEHPEIANEYNVQTSSRRFSITEPKVMTTEHESTKAS